MITKTIAFECSIKKNIIININYYNYNLVMIIIKKRNSILQKEKKDYD